MTLYLFIVRTNAAVSPIQIIPKEESMLSEEDYLIIQGNSLMALSSSVVVVPQVLGCLNGDPDGIDTLMAEIIKRESGGDPKACNTEFGCGAGMGLAGFISSTWNNTLDRMKCRNAFNVESCLPAYLPEECDEHIVLPESEDKHEAIFNGTCNEIAARWLLKTDGIIHWDPYSGPYDLTSL